MPQDLLTSKGKIRGFTVSKMEQGGMGRGMERGWLGWTQLDANSSSNYLCSLLYLSEVEFPNLKNRMIR